MPNFSLFAEFTVFIWDILVLELAVVSCLVAPLLPAPFARTRPPSLRSPVLVLRMVAIKIAIMSGLVKVLSRCPSWTNLTALHYTLATQPMPTAIAWAIHNFPGRVLKLFVASMLLIEIPGSLLMLWPGLEPKTVAFLAQTTLAVFLSCMGNHNFYLMLGFSANISLLVPDIDWTDAFAFVADRVLNRRSAAPFLPTAPSPPPRATHRRSGSGLGPITVPRARVLRASSPAPYAGPLLPLLTTVRKHYTHAWVGAWVLLAASLFRWADNKITFAVPADRIEAILAVLLQPFMWIGLIHVAIMAWIDLTRFVNDELAPEEANEAAVRPRTWLDRTSACLRELRARPRKVVRTAHVMCTLLISLLLFSCNFVTLGSLERNSLASLVAARPMQLYKKMYIMAEPFRLSGSYSLFKRTIGRADNGTGYISSRSELIFEASTDGEEWQTLRFRYKPSDAAHMPRFSAPHQPRLDIQMYSAAVRSAQVAPWVISFAHQMTMGSPDVRLLLAPGSPYTTGPPPTMIRVKVFDFEFTRAYGWGRERSCKGCNSSELSPLF